MFVAYMCGARFDIAIAELRAGNFFPGAGGKGTRLFPGQRVEGHMEL